jgi:hypothetical protein
MSYGPQNIATAEEYANFRHFPGNMSYGQENIVTAMEVHY